MRGVAVMAMFPLGTVLLPGAVLPLRVFEPRYRQLVVDCLAADGDPEFGVTLIERGWEVGGGDTRSTAGTIARVVDVHALPDGQYALVAVGTRRITVEAWEADDPYPRARVADWPDEDDTHPGSMARMLDVARRSDALAGPSAPTAVGEPATEDLLDPDDVVRSSYVLAGRAPIGPADRQRALCCLGPSARTESVAASLDDVEAMLRFRGHL